MPFGDPKDRRGEGRRPRRFRPEAATLERKALLTQASLLTSASAGGPPPLSPLIDGNPTDPPSQPAVPPDALGVMHTSAVNQSLPGFQVAYVGDVNGDGFDDYLIGAPNTVVNNGLPAPSAGAGRAYLVFGSRQVGQTAPADFRQLVNNVEVPPGNPQGRPPRAAIDERVGDLDQLGNRFGGSTQTSPINNNPGFAFDGLIFTTSATPDAQFGASVAAAGDVNRDGFADFLIGAPGANSNRGRAYLFYGSAGLSNIPSFQRLVDLDSTTPLPSAVRITTITNTLAGARTGQAVAGVGDVIADAQPDIAIGAPFASIGLGAAQNGAVYLLSGALFSSATLPATIDLSLIGQVGNNAGIRFVGANSGDFAGWSIAGAGNFDGDTTAGANRPIDDLLIGAPGNPYGFTTTPGRGYLVYGAVDLVNRFITAGTAPSVLLSQVGDPAAGAVLAGAVFVGEAPGDLTGMGVSTAGNFDGVAPTDILIGSPGFAFDQGRVHLIYGRTVSQGRYLGTYQLSSLNSATTPALEMLGTVAGDLAGWSVSATQNINNDTLNEILVGSPGFSANSGATYLIAGNINRPTGTINLLSVAGSSSPTDPLPGLQFVLGLNAGYMGWSVSGPISLANQPRTIDNDNIGDLLIGAPLHTPPFNGLGAGYLVEGSFLRSQDLLITPVRQGDDDDDDDDDDDTDIGVGFGRFTEETIEDLAPRFGESFSPSPLTLSKLVYKPLPYRAAYQQWRARNGFGAREWNFFNPGNPIERRFSSNKAHKRDGIFTLPKKTFTTGKYGTQPRYRVGNIPGPIQFRGQTIPVQPFLSAGRTLRG